MAKETKKEELFQADPEAVRLYTKDKTLKELRDQREEIEKRFNKDLTVLNRLLESFYAYCKWEKSVLKSEERADLKWDTSALNELNKKVEKLIEENNQLLPTEETGRISRLPLFRQLKAAMGRAIWFFLKPRIAIPISKQMGFNSDVVNQLNRSNEQVDYFLHQLRQFHDKLLAFIKKNNEIYRQLFEIQRTYNHQLMLFFQKIIPLINAKDVEVIRLLTYLPLKRMDIIFEEFDKKQEFLQQSLKQQQEELNNILNTLHS
jgi:hypothetical protein